MPINCLFHLPRSTPVYYTGEQVSGTVTLTVNKKPAVLEAIRITLLGISKTKWTEPGSTLPEIDHNDSTSRLSKPAKLIYSATQNHINETKQLKGPIILTGNTQLRFEFQLPQTLPATCQVPHGAIKYTLQLSLERRGKHIKIFTQNLIVRKHIKLNDLRPQTKSSNSCTLRLPRSVFVPGQCINYQLEQNHLVVPNKYLIRICQCVAYRSEIPEISTKTVMRVLAESELTEDALHLPLTSAIMSDPQARDDSIQISYYIEALSVSIKVDKLQLPIYVSTVAPPMRIISSNLKTSTKSHSFCFVNFALTHSELFPSTNFAMPNAYSRDTFETNDHGYSENMKLLQRYKK